MEENYYTEEELALFGGDTSPQCVSQKPGNPIELNMSPQADVAEPRLLDFRENRGKASVNTGGDSPCSYGAESEQLNGKITEISHSEIVHKAVTVSNYISSGISIFVGSVFALSGVSLMLGGMFTDSTDDVPTKTIMLLMGAAFAFVGGMVAVKGIKSLISNIRNK